MSALAGELANKPIPIFLSLREVADRQGTLLEQIQQKLTSYQVSDSNLEALLTEEHCLLSKWVK